MKVDLHIHSVYSDSSDTVEDIMRKAKERGVTHLAVTDHDTTAQNPEALEMGKQYGVAVIPGIEISAYDYKKGVQAHILGYAMQDPAPAERLCAPLRRARRENAEKQVEILRRQGYQISMEDLAGHYCIYKHHIMRHLTETGQAEEMFGVTYEKLFTGGGSCDLDLPYIEVREAVRAVRQGGGFPVLAHPGQQQNTSLIPELIPEGLWGVELQHYANNRFDRAIISELCKGTGLYFTGGSDSHGSYTRYPRNIGDNAMEGTISAESLSDIIRKYMP